MLCMGCRFLLGLRLRIVGLMGITATVYHVFVGVCDDRCSAVSMTTM